MDEDAARTGRKTRGAGIDPRTFYEGKTVLVTGAGSGLGRALALEAGRRGAGVYASDADSDAAEKTCRLFENGSPGAFCAPLRLDVTDPEDFDRVFAGIERESGALDVLINNAGQCAVGESATVPPDRFCRIIDVNLKGTAYGTASAFRRMVRAGEGLIVNISSLSGQLAYPVTLAYTASKAGIDALTTGLAAEARGTGVRVSLVRLGTVDTPAYRTQEVWGMSRNDFVSLLPGRMLPANRASRIILDRAARGRSKITAPLSSAAVLFVIRRFPGTAALIRNRAMRRFRSAAARRKGDR